MHDRQRAKRELLDIQEAVSEALCRLDPLALIEAGAPSSEYDPEIGTIMPRLGEASTRDDLARIIHEEFVAWFGSELAGSEARYNVAANEVWSHWLLHRARILSDSDDVELVEPGTVRVLYLGELLEPVRIMRLGTRYFVESAGDPGVWWMGSRDSRADIHVWGQYGSHEDAFTQH